MKTQSRISSLAELQERDLKFIQNPDNWPNWPYLPLKRTMHEYDPSYGCLIVTAKPVPSTVWVINVWHLPKKLSEAKKIEYESFQKMFDDGWRVD